MQEEDERISKEVFKQIMVDKTDVIMIIMATMALIFFGTVCVYGIWYATTYTTIYTMPNGIECTMSDITGGGFGGATHEFYSCSNGKVYINPEYYTQRDVKQ